MTTNAGGMAASPREGAGPRYRCFLSYRHGDNKQPGRQWASWLHHAIETYEVPADLVGTRNERGEEIPPRIFPVFRDEEELPADADLSGPIVRALEESGHLVVLCSPGAAASRFVADEITRFKAMGRSDRVLAAIVSGEPNASTDAGKQAGGTPAARECFPLPLRREVAPDGTVTGRPAEPIAADFRLEDGEEGWTSPEAYRQALRAAGVSAGEARRKVEAYAGRLGLMKLKVIAGILALPLGVLTKRDQAYQLEQARRRARVLRGWLAAMGVLLIAAVAAGTIAWRARQTAQRQRGAAEEARAAAEESARQKKRDSDLLTANIVLLAQHSLMQKEDPVLRAMAVDFLANTRGVFLPAYDPASFQKSADAASLCRLISESQLLGDGELGVRAMKGLPLTPAQRKAAETAMIYTTAASEIYSRMLARADLDEQLKTIHHPRGHLEMLALEGQLNRGTVLFHLGEHRAAAEQLETFLAKMEAFSPPGEMAAGRHGDLFEACSVLAFAYRLAGEKDRALRAAGRALDHGSMMVRCNADQSPRLAMRYATFNYLKLLEPSRQAAMAAHLEEAGLTGDRVREIEADLDRVGR